MPLFISDEEFSKCSGDASLVAEKADSFIRDLYKELDTVKAQADAADITAEQSCSLLEHKFLSLSQEFSALESQKEQLQSSLNQRVSDLAQIQSDKHQLHLLSIGRDGEVERLTTEVSELHKSKRQLMELVENKDSEISEKNATLKSYLDKIVSLTENAAKKEARLSEIEAELARSQASCTRLLQEKELIERHNVWLNEELTSKVDGLIELRRTHADLEADMSTKLAEVERQFSECSNSLKWNKEKVKELETKLISAQEELCSSRDASAANEERLSAELSTVNKLVELYKESSEEWSSKAGELEGVIKALETHLVQVENDHKEKFEKEVSARKQIEKEAADLKQQLEKCEAEIESSKKTSELNLIPLSSMTAETWSSFERNDMVEDNQMIVPKIPVGVSGTALAASLLRDGWSLAKMYAKYQEAVDAFRHEQLGRKESEAILQRVLYELEQKAEIILDERVDHERITEAYSIIDQKLQHSVFEQANLEKTIQELKAELKRQERDHTLAQKEIDDLQRQVTILLKECRDIQLRCGSVGGDYAENNQLIATVKINAESDAEKVISERLLTFKDINGLVEQNVQLRSLVRNLSEQIEKRESELKEQFEVELKKQTDEAASKVSVVLQRAEEQGHMIESLHTSVAMYKRLYEEEHKHNSSYPHSSETAPAVVGNRRMDLRLLLEGSETATKKSQEQAADRVRCLEEDLAKSRSEIIALRAERDKLSLESNFARDRLDSFMKEFEHQRNEVNGVLARNVEFSQLVIEYQRKLRESSESIQAAEDLSRKLTMEVTVQKHEKELLSNAEKRACEEVRSLSERVHRLQASLDTLQSTEEVREEARVAERRKQEEYVKRIEREWAEAKKELQEERDNVRNLTLDREQTLKNAMRQVEEMGKELAKALQSVTTAETRAGVAEARLSDLEKKFKSSDAKVADVDVGTKSSPFSTDEVVEKLQAAKKEVEKFKEEAQANKDHMLQYKNIAEVNETALKQMECAHENFKIEADRLKKTLEAELLSLRERVAELEHECSMKSEEVISAAAGKDGALTTALAEIATLKQENEIKISKMEAMEIQISALKDDLQKEHERWRSSQSNYERQVILQSETIQELTKTSQALASLQHEASDMRKLSDALKAENDELKLKWNIEKTMLEESKNAAEKNYTEINEQNKILHSRLEALHIQIAEKDRSSAGVFSSSTSTDGASDSGLQNVINYLRRSKEIAETEISLLKQEKLRLQTQLESALKAAETAQTSLNTERSNSRTMLFTEEEIKSLQFQVREMSLLRESNMQLREENKHNFEECLKLREVAQKARAEYENLESLLRERQMEVEALKKEIEIHRMEKTHLEQKMSEVLARCGNISAEDYDRMKEDVRLLQEKLKDKDIQIEEMKKVVSGKQVIISQLEQDVTNCRLELTEREKRINDILQVDANLKLDMERQRKMVASFKRRFESLSKEKEEMRRENQTLAKQLEDAKQGKRSTGDVSGEQAIKEKDTKIQILEKHLERQREELRKEKEDSRMEKARRLKSEKAIKDSFNNVEQEKAKYVNELEKHRQAIKQLSEDLDKLKHAEANLPEGTSVLQLLSGTALDELAAAYVLAVENFEKAASLVSGGLGASAVSADTSVVADGSLSTDTGRAVPPQAPRPTSSAAPSPVTATSPLRAKTTQVNEKRPTLPRTGVETRKMARRLVRPRLGKPEEPQGDAEMSEIDGSNSSVKSAPSQDTETQVNLISQTQSQSVVRKRLASTSEVLEDSTTQVESSGDVAPVQKKSKSSDTPVDVAEGQSTTPLESAVTLQAIEESSDAAGDVPEVTHDDVMEPEKEAETTEKAEEDPKEPQQLDTTSQGDRTNVVDENLDGANETDMVDDVLTDQAEQDNQQVESGSEKEEGEIPDSTDLEAGGDMSVLMESPDHTAMTPVASPTRIDEDTMVAGTADFGEPNSPEPLIDDKNEEGELIEEDTVEGSDKSNDGNEQISIETDPAVDIIPVADESTSTTVADASVSKQATSSSVPAEAETKPVSPVNSSSRLVNLQERAKERAVLRQAGVTPEVNRPPARLRGRVAPRHGVRGRGGQRGGRGQAPPDHGQGS